MKQRVDLYLLTTDTFTHSLAFVCQLVDKTYRQGYASIIQLESPVEAAALDQLLWTFRDVSFIPHQLSTPNRIVVSEATHSTPPSLRIHCCLSDPPHPIEEPRLLQIVPNQPHLHQLARQHYRFYQQQGYALTTHHIK